METLITFKAGRCELEGKKVKPLPTPGYLYLHIEDEMLHFCWRARASAAFDAEVDLIMFPGDCTFLPYLGVGASQDRAGDKHSPTNGRIFELKFSSSSQRFYFWLQSQSQHKDGNLSWFSKRDLLIGEVVNEILADNEDEWRRGLARLRRGGDGEPPAEQEDDVMEDVEDDDGPAELSGGAGAGATGGDLRQEGEDSRRDGSDGGRATSTDASDVVQNFLRSLQGGNAQASGQQQSSYDKPFGTLSDLFHTNDTIAHVKSASPAEIDALCSHLPASIFLLSQESASSLSSVEPSPEAAQAAIEALSTEQKRGIIERVLRSPQLHQSLGSLTVALRDGGLPQIGEALGLSVENGGLIRGGSMPVGGGEAVERFVDSIKRTVERDAKK